MGTETKSTAIPESIQSAMVRATTDVFKIQFSLDSTGGTPFPHGQLKDLPASDLVGIGLVVLDASRVGFGLCFPQSTCLALMGHAFGRRVEGVDRSVREGMLELVGILGARSKSVMRERGLEVLRNIPVACVDEVKGCLTVQKMADTIIIPFKIEKVGEFYLHLF